MNQEKHAIAVAALTDLIRSEIDDESNGVQKFVRIQRLSMLGQQLAKENAKRVKDFGQQGNGLNMIGGGNIVYGMPMANQLMQCGPDDVVEGLDDGQEIAAAGYNYAGPLDQAGLLRQGIKMFADQNKVNRVTDEQCQRQSRAVELNELLRSKKLLENAPSEIAARIQQRIDRLSVLIAEPEPTKETPHADLVPAQPLRRHPPELATPQPDAGDPAGSLAAGEDRDGGAEETGDEGQRVVEAVVLNGDLRQA